MSRMVGMSVWESLVFLLSTPWVQVAIAMVLLGAVVLGLVHGWRDARTKR